ncbi:hypothetical protein EMCRGX_G002701 [Ephydatia muelleri]
MSSPCASVSASNPLQARIWCTVADMFLKVGKTSDVLSCVWEAQFLAPHFPLVLLSYGCVMQASDNEKASGELYRSALALQSTNLISLTLIGTLCVETAAPISEAVEKVSKVLGERQTRQNCATLSAIAAGDLSGLSQQCKNAILNNAANVIQGAICTSACNDLYRAEVQCYGAAATQAAYKQLCTNGYQGEAARQATAHYVTVGAALIAAATAVRAMMH